MGKYKTTVRRDEPRVQGPAPIWRGIGCLLIVLVPILSYAAAELSIPFFQKQGLVPREMLVAPQAPDWLYVMPVVAQIFQTVFGRPGILAVLVLTVVYIVVIGGILSVVYAYMYRLAAPSRYGPMDAEPTYTKIKKYKR